MQHCGKWGVLEMQTRWNSFSWSPVLGLGVYSTVGPSATRGRGCLHTGGPQDRDSAKKPLEISAPRGLMPTSGGPQSPNLLTFLVLLHFSFRPRD